MGDLVIIKQPLLTVKPKLTNPGLYVCTGGEYLCTYKTSELGRTKCPSQYFGMLQSQMLLTALTTQKNKKTALKINKQTKKDPSNTSWGVNAATPYLGKTKTAQLESSPQLDAT